MMKTHAPGPAGKKVLAGQKTTEGRLSGTKQKLAASWKRVGSELDGASSSRRQAGRHEKPPGVRYGAQQNVEEIYPV